MRRMAIVAACVCALVPVCAVAQEDARLKLERDRLELEKAKFQLERDRFELSKQSDWYDWQPLGWFAALGSALLTYVLTRRAERAKHRDEIAAVFDQELRKGRISAYQKLWRGLRPLSLYSGANITRGDIAKLRLSMRDWYFDLGMFLTEGEGGTRERYFALQHGLVLVSQNGQASDVLFQESDNISHADADADRDKFATFSKNAEALPKEVLESGAMQYRFVRALGSLLRTATTDDVQTRVRARALKA